MGGRGREYDLVLSVGVKSTISGDVPSHTEIKFHVGSFAQSTSVSGGLVVT